MQDQAPRNRAERRAAARKRPAAGKAAALVLPQRPQSQNAPPGPDIGTGGPSAADEEADEMAAAPSAPPLGGRPDKPPASASKSHHKGAGKEARIHQGLMAYYTLAGMGVARFDQIDGQIVVASAQGCADAWLAAGKANPQIMRALELVTIAGPYMALIMVHAEMATAIMQRHGTSPLALFRNSESANAHTPSEPSGPQRGATMPPSSSGPPEGAPPPLPYQPVGAHAPTEAPPPPPVYVDPGLLVIPDEGIPAEIDVALRQMARQSGRPYEELRQEALVELAQMRMAEQRGRNGNGHTPGALGAPIARE